jgi:hypothetical protein
MYTVRTAIAIYYVEFKDVLVESRHPETHSARIYLGFSKAVTINCI